MVESNAPASGQVRRIVVRKNGPYVVYGTVPLVHKTQVVSEYGEPLTWQKDGDYTVEESYELCRCGQSGQKPFCDRTHAKCGFDGTESADPGSTAARQVVYGTGTRIIVKRDFSICAEAGFCGNRLTNIEAMVGETADPQVRAQVMAMIENCPSGSYTFALAAGEEEIEPDLPQQIAATTEITDDGPIMGPLWVTGSIPVARADGQPFETRNRVTLCCCGLSSNKPLCDGTHRHSQQAAIQAARSQA